MLTRWYRTGVFYSLDVGVFQDANGDGVGDFQGLMARLDYLAPPGCLHHLAQPDIPVAACGTAGMTSPTTTTCTRDWAVSVTSRR